MVYISKITNLLFTKKISLSTKRRLIGSIFPKKIQFENKKIRTADINPVLHKIAHFNRVNRKNKKRDKSKKEDLSRCVLKTGLSCAESQNQHFEKKADATMQLIFYFLKLIKASFTRYRNQKNRNIRFGFSSVHPIELFSKQTLDFLNNFFLTS